MVTAESSLATPNRNSEFPGYPRPPVLVQLAAAHYLEAQEKKHEHGR